MKQILIISLLVISLLINTQKLVSAEFVEGFQKSSNSTASKIKNDVLDSDTEETRAKRGHGGGGHGPGPGRGGGASGPIYFCGYIGSKEGYGGYGK